VRLRSRARGIDRLLRTCQAGRDEFSALCNRGSEARLRVVWEYDIEIQHEKSFDFFVMFGYHGLVVIMERDS